MRDVIMIYLTKKEAQDWGLIKGKSDFQKLKSKLIKSMVKKSVLSALTGTTGFLAGLIASKLISFV